MQNVETRSEWLLVSQYYWYLVSALEDVQIEVVSRGYVYPAVIRKSIRELKKLVESHWTGLDFEQYSDSIIRGNEGYDVECVAT